MNADDRMTNLVMRAMERDEAAFGDLIELTRDRLIRRVRRRGLQYADAEAVAFTVYREVWQTMTRLRDPSRFEAWIGVIGRRKASDEARRDRIRNEFEEEVDDERLAKLAVESDAEAATQRRDGLERIFAGLNEADRELLTAKYLHRVTIHEIARLSGVKIHQIKHRLKKAKQRLRRLRSGEIGDPDDDEQRAKAPGSEERRKPLGW